MLHQPRTLTSTEEMRLFLGLLAQPFVAAGVAFLSFPWLLLDRTGSPLARPGEAVSDPTGAAVSVALGTFILAVVVTVAAVAPTAVWVLKRRPVTFGSALLFGLGLGNLPVAIGGALAGFYGLAGALRVIMFGSLIGVVGAAAFWGISIRGRDFSRDAPADESQPEFVDT